MNTSLSLPVFLRKKSTIFKHFPQFTQVTYSGASPQKAYLFITYENNVTGYLYVFLFIKEAEGDVWQACETLFKEILAAVETGINGVFHFELVHFELSEKLESFQWKEFSHGMTDLARSLKVGESKLVQYCSILGVFTKYSDEDYGKIVFNPKIMIIPEGDESLGRQVGQWVKQQEFKENTSSDIRLIFFDLSRNPILNQADCHQQGQFQRINKMIEKRLSSAIKEAWIIDVHGAYNFLQKPQLELDLFGV